VSDALQSTLKILFALFLVLLNGFFVAAEFALVKVRATRIEELAAKGVFGAAKTREALRHLDAYLSATQLGITLASLGLGYIGEPAFAHLIEPLFGGLSDGTKHLVSFIIAFTIITALHIVIGELAPKSWAIQRAEQVTLAVIYPLDIFYKVFQWPIRALNYIAGLALRPFGLQSAEEHGTESHSEEEVRLILSASHQGGEITASELNLVNQVFDFSQRQAWEVMVPRPDVVFLSTEVSIVDNARRAYESEYTRLPLIEGGSPDEIVGLIHIRDLSREAVEGDVNLSDAERLRSIARDLPRIPETKPIDQLLREFQRQRQHMAVVVDEYGGTAGIVTIEDIIEEIVGDIQDEFDRTTPEMEPAGKDCYNVDARMPLTKLERTLNLEGVETEVDTLGGWILSNKGVAPVRVGDAVAYGEAMVTVTEMVGRRVRKVRVCVPETRITNISQEL